MAGTATRYDVAKIPAGIIVQLWADLAVPSAGNRLTLHTDGTPDATANPSAKHLGHTDAGLTISAAETIQEFFADEVPYPISASTDTSELTLAGSALQVEDEELMKILAANIGTYSTAAGYKQITLGYKSTIAYTSVAAIWPTPMDATKFTVVQLYNARNTTGFSFQIGRKVRASSAFTFKGYGLTARAAADQLGNYWWQI
jgi:hypothetical protein